jgi:hypothetical protein
MSDIKAIWRNQPVEESHMLTIDELRARAQKMRSRFSRRNLLLYAYSLFNIVAGLWLVANDAFPRMQAPMLLMIVAHLFVLWQVWKRFGLGKVPAMSSGQTVLQFHRQELERQHSAVANAWLWYILPFMPPFLWELGIWLHGIDMNTAEGAASIRMFVMVVFSAILFWGCVWLLFSRHATRLELELQRLASVRAE